MPFWGKQNQKANRAPVTNVCLSLACWIIDASFEMNCIHSGGVNTHLLLEEQSPWPGPCDVKVSASCPFAAQLPQHPANGPVLTFLVWSLFRADLLNRDKASQPCWEREPAGRYGHRCQAVGELSCRKGFGRHKSLVLSPHLLMTTHPEVFWAPEVWGWVGENACDGCEE